MNSPLMMMVQTLNQGGDPMGVLRQMSGGDPRVGQFMQLVGGRTPAQLAQMANNIARERGIDVQALARQIGLNLPG